MKSALLGGHSLALLADEGLVNVWDDSTSGNGGLDQGVKFFVSANGQLQVTWSDSLHLKVLGGVTCEFEHLGCEVLKDSCSVNGGRGTNTAVGAHSALQESVDSSNGELKRSDG